MTSADVLEFLGPIWHEKTETARRARQRISTVMQWGVAMEFRPDDPCDRVDVNLRRPRLRLDAIPGAEEHAGGGLAVDEQM